REFYRNDWTDLQADIDDLGIFPNAFFQPQYGALATFSSVGHSWYHAGTLSLRERLGTKLTMDFNYTLSHSLDDASGLQTSGGYGAAFILTHCVNMTIFRTQISTLGTSSTSMQFGNCR